MSLNERSLSRRLPWLALGASTLALALGGCADGGKYTPSPGGKADFSAVVFMGDSLTAGYQSGSLLDSAQPHGYAALIAQQANFRIALPLIAPPGAPSVLELQSYDPPNFPVIVQAPGTTTGRDDVTVVPSDAAVPGATVYDVLNTAALPNPTTGQEEITQLVLGFPSLLSGTTNTQFSLAQSWNPTTIFIWIGNNDALNGVFATSIDGATDIDTFTAEYTQTIGALAQATKAHLVIANIPDVTLVPYLTPQAELVGFLEAQGVPSDEAPLLLEELNIFPGDSVLLDALPDFEEQLDIILGGGTPTPLGAGQVLKAADAQAIQALVLQYNQVIAGVAAQVGATLVDIHTEFENAAANGVVADGYTATFGFLGGLFSLDGIHPTNTGYGVLANTFIDAVNNDLGSSIKDVDLNAIAKVDPLYPPNLGVQSGAKGAMAKQRLQMPRISRASAAAIHRAVEQLRSRPHTSVKQK